LTSRLLARPRKSQANKPMTDIAPFLLDKPENAPIVPSTGRFLLPVCITEEELHLLLGAALFYAEMSAEKEIRHLLPLMQAMEYIGNPEYAACLGINAIEENECKDFAPFAPFIGYAPQNPYNDPELVPSGYFTPPFRLWSQFETILPDWVDEWLGGLIDWATGYQQGDVVVDISSLPLLANWQDLLTNGLPRIEINVTGSGEVELHLLAFPLGGRLLVTVDIEPNLADIFNGIIGGDVRIIELNREVFGIPPETDLTVIEEVAVSGAGAHTIYLTFIPTVDAEIVPVNFGGGLRKIVLCGFDEQGEIMGIEDVRFNTTNCTFEKRLEGVWSAISGGDEWLMCVEALMATKAEIKEAIIESAEQLAAQMISGTPENLASGGAIEINDKGEIAVKSGGIAPDDPTTSSDEEKRSGGAQGVYNGFRQLILDINGWITAGYTAAEINFLVGSKYIINGQMLDAITAYRSSFQTPPAGWTTPVITTSLAQYIYCRGNNRESIAKYILASWDIEVFNLLSINNGLEQAQLDAWFAQGETAPSTDYITYSCVPVDTEEFTLDTAYLPTGVYKQGTSIHKLNHRILIEVSGKVNHSTDASYQDFFWHVAVNGTKTLIGTSGTFGSIQFNQPFGNPPQSKVPFESSGVYRLTMDTTSAQALNFRRIIQGVYLGSGSFTIKFTDLGEILA
jgi:hypothetical protein